MALIPGSAAYRLVSMLQQMPEGASLSFRECADYTQIAAKNVNSNCAVAVRDGLLERFHDGKGWRMRLGLEGRALKAVAAPAEPAATPEAPAVAEDAAAAPDAFDACLWLNGAVTMEGVEVLPSGHVCLKPHQAARLAQLLLPVAYQDEGGQA